jgi:hypothetical protein
LTGQLLTAGTGRYAHAFLGVTRGIHDLDATPERLRESCQELVVEHGYFEPATAAEEVAPFSAEKSAS